MKELLDFENELGVILQVNIRRSPIGGEAKRFYASFFDVNVINLQEGLLEGSTGNGSSIDEAIENYSKNLSGKLLKVKGKQWGYAPELIYKNKKF